MRGYPSGQLLECGSYKTTSLMLDIDSHGANDGRFLWCPRWGLDASLENEEADHELLNENGQADQLVGRFCLALRHRRSDGSSKFHLVMRHRQSAHGRLLRQRQRMPGEDSHWRAAIHSQIAARAS